MSSCGGSIRKNSTVGKRESVSPSPRISSVKGKRKGRPRKMQRTTTIAATRKDASKILKNKTYARGKKLDTKHLGIRKHGTIVDTAEAAEEFLDHQKKRSEAKGASKKGKGKGKGRPKKDDGTKSLPKVNKSKNIRKLKKPKNIPREGMRGGRRGGSFGGRGGDFRGGRGGGRGGRGGRSFVDFNAPPDQIQLLGEFTHVCEDYLVCKSSCESCPLITRPVYLENKSKIGIIDDIFGPVNSYGISIKPDQGVKAASFKLGSKIYVNPQHLRNVNFFMGRSRGPPKTGRMMGRQGEVPGVRRTGNMISRGRGDFGGNRGRGSFSGRGAFPSRGSFRGGTGGIRGGGFRGRGRGS